MQATERVIDGDLDDTPASGSMSSEIRSMRVSELSVMLLPLPCSFVVEGVRVDLAGKGRRDERLPVFGEEIELGGEEVR